MNGDKSIKYVINWADILTSVTDWINKHLFALLIIFHDHLTDMSRNRLFCTSMTLIAWHFSDCFEFRNPNIANFVGRTIATLLQYVPPWTYDYIMFHAKRELGYRWI
jgi:hypothetical protein